MTTTIHQVRKVITMTPARPEASHVALRDGRFLGAGSLDELRGRGAFDLDQRFADRVLMPGLVEGHAHLMAGALWRIRALGMCVNLFSNHHFYWGDQHYATTVGPERAARPARQQWLHWPGAWCCSTLIDGAGR